MTVATTTSRVQYSGTGAATSFPVPFRFLANADLLVILRAANGAETTLALGSGYTVSGAGGSSGTVTTTVAPAAGTVLTIQRVVAATQTTDYVESSPLFAETLEGNLDRLTMLAQQAEDRANRTPQLSPASSVPTPVMLPEGAGRYIRWNGAGTALEATDAVLDSGSFLQSGAGAVLRAMSAKVGEVVSVKDFGAKGDGVTDDTAAIQAAIDAVCPMVGGGDLAGTVFIPRGRYVVTSTLNLTNSRLAGTRARDGLRVVGESPWGTTIIGQTGSGKAVVETTGAHALLLENLRVSSASAPTGRSTVGIFQGLASVLPQTQNQEFRRVLIDMHDEAAANGGIGTVGVWNFGAEENTYHGCWINANLPAFFTGYKTSPNLGVTAPASYLAQAASHSCGMNTFSGENFLTTVNARQPSVITEDVTGMTALNVYMGNTGSGGSNKVAWRVYGTLSGFRLDGIIESHSTAFDILGALQGGAARFTFGVVGDPAAERLKLARGLLGVIQDCDLKFLDNQSPNRDIVSATPSAPFEQISCYVQNSRLSSNAPAANTKLPENLAWNPNTMNVQLSGSGYRTEYGLKSQSIQIAPKNVWVNLGITSAEVARVIMPTVSGFSNGTSISVRLRGVLTSGSVGTNAKATRSVDAVVVISSDNAGAISTAAAVGGPEATVSTLPGGNALTGVSVTGTAVGTSHVQIIVTPTRTGANNETVQFQGAAELLWNGNESRAPRLEVV